jgi:C4-dicarboxylate transporter DctM subunit
MTENTEIGLITPPMGLNLLISKSVFNLPLGQLIRTALLWIVVLVLFLFILIAFPQIGLWFPSMMFKG